MSLPWKLRSRERGSRRSGSSGRSPVRCSLFAYAVCACAVVQLAGQTRTPQQGVYTAAQAKRGDALYSAECKSCHGDTLQGSLAPPLTGDEFAGAWGNQSLLDLVAKIQNTMPASAPGKLNRQQSVDIAAYVLQTGKFPGGNTELGSDDAALKPITFPARGAAPRAASTQAGAPTFGPGGNLAQVMRGILFPSSNLIFNVQNQDPGAQRVGWKPGETAFSWVDWGAGIYSGWELVDNAAVTLIESAPLMLTPGRRCENGKPVPVGRPDWMKFTTELADAGRAAYKASQSRNRDAVIEATNQVADACLNCHVAYRDKPGGTEADPSNKVARCVP